LRKSPRCATAPPTNDGKVAARRAELEAELEKLSQYDRPAKKSQAATGSGVKARKGSENKQENKDEAKEPIAKAA